MLVLQPASAQNKFEQINYKIDSLTDIGLPKSALKEVDKLEETARKNNDPSQQIRAVIYRMNLQSYIEENALVAIINRLKIDIDKATYPAKPVLQSLLAEIYWKYYQRNRYQFSERSRLYKPDADFTKWDLHTIINETSNLYQLSLANALKEQHTPVNVLEGVLEGDEATRYLRPTLYDFLVHRAFDFYLGDEPELIKPRLPFLLNSPALFINSKDFVSMVFNTSDTSSNFYRGIKLLQQISIYHIKGNNAEALADIDLKRLHFLYAKAKLAGRDSLYLAALQQIAVTYSGKPISSRALVLMGQYYQDLDSLTTAHGYFKKAALAYPQSLGGKNALKLMAQIEAKSLSATMEDINIPGKPLLALLSYQNLTNAKISIFKLSSAQLSAYNKFNDYQTFRKQQLEFLQKIKPVAVNEVNWPDAGDYRKHSAEIKIDALSPGNYVLMASAGNGDDKGLTGLADFKVSRLAYVARGNPDQSTEIRVLNRETGVSLAGVKVDVKGQFYGVVANSKSSQWIKISESGISNKDGAYFLNKILNDVSVDLTVSGDTLMGKTAYISGVRNDDNDDEPEDKTVLFTDRQIYRPGQTIYFKGLQLSVLNGKSKIMPDEEVEVTFSDVNGKEVSSLKLKSNEFGTFSGSFIIPQNMLSGDVELETDDGKIEVKVEEYKRPTFQAEFSPVKESYKLNDSVTVKGTVTAFSGYGLSQARVAYHIVRSQNRVLYNDAMGKGLYGSRYLPPVTEEIKADTTTTDDQGKFELKFKAIGSGDDKANTTYSYAVNADVTDATGETHSAQTTILIGKNDIAIVNSIPDVLFTRDSLQAFLRINNLNGQPQNGRVKVNIYALQQAESVFINRLWQKPDKYILTDADFKKSFPQYAYGNEDVFSTWAKTTEVLNLDLDVRGDKAATVDLNTLRNKPSGVYRVVLSARNTAGDTTSITKYVELVSKPAKPSNINNWVTPMLTDVKAGSNAEFLVGIGQKIKVLMERYHGAKLISSKWITIGGKQQSIKVPIGDKDKDVAVQFMMVYQNRTYNSYQKITIIDNDNALKLKLLTFRNKLQPGQKEQWKIQVSNKNNEKQVAEMLAGMYDASLDDITTGNSWEAALYSPDKYQPNYFAWNSYGFINTSVTNAVKINEVDNTTLLPDYERLNLLGYNYYGGYNPGYREYLQTIQANLKATEFDRKLAADFLKNAALVKNGYIITGKVIDSKDGEALPGITVTIAELGIGTTTNSKGVFKIKVLVNAALNFSFIGYKPQTISTSKAANVIIKLEGSSNALNEVTVVGYATQRKKSLTGAVSTIMIRGNSSIYGSRASEDESAGYLEGRVAGIQVTQAAPGAGDKVVMREIRTNPNPKPVAVRRNFNETAFFYPQLHTDDKGQILIEFTMPEALTKWKFRALAHTRELNTGYLEADVVTQKQLSISSNMPRFLREGDTVTFSARLANLTAEKLTGNVTIQLFNGINMQPVKLLANPEQIQQAFELNALTNKAVSFKLIIPQGLDALTYRLTAEAANYSDGEENTVPVLPNRMLVTESMPMMVRAGQTRDFMFNKLLTNKSNTLKSKSLTLEYTQNPAWYAVQALPYMMEFPYECSEQIFSRYYANSLGASLLNSTPVIKQVFERWKSSNSTELLSNLEKNQELKTTLVEETPWLRDAASESDQKKRLALLFDLNKMSNELALNLDKLQKRQLPDGGFPWFAGDRADRYITQHILASIGQLYLLKIVSDSSQVLKGMKEQALGYLDSQLAADDKKARQSKMYENRTINETEIHAWYARSYFINAPIPANTRNNLNHYLKRAEKLWVAQSVYEKGMIALTMQRYGKPLIAKAIINSLLETAQQTNDMGMYWANNQRGYYWYQAPVETQSLLIELFTETGTNKKAVEEMKIWLLRNKQTNNWKTTKATAAACYALLLKQSEWLTAANTSEIKLDNKLLSELKNDIKAEAGTGYIKTAWADEQVKPALGKVAIKNNGQSISWGAMYWQYLEQMDKITPSNTDIHLERKYFIQKQTASGPVLTAVDATHQPKTGDLLKVVVYLKAGRDFEYVQLKDMRPAGTEPVNALSEYKYQDGLYYYQVTKDVATNFFISLLSKGNYVFEYQLRVAQPGNFSTGVATVQCMYAPEFNAHSEGLRMEIKP
ncbi:alpha-2-macroglobulin family protein [Mucilaginibacter phyllosphaerae]